MAYLRVIPFLRVCRFICVAFIENACCIHLMSQLVIRPQSLDTHNQGFLGMEDVEISLEETVRLDFIAKLLAAACDDAHNPAKHRRALAAVEEAREITTRDSRRSDKLTLPAIHMCKTWLRSHPNGNNHQSLRALLWMAAHAGVLTRHYASGCECRHEHPELICAIIETALQEDTHPIVLWVALDLLELSDFRGRTPFDLTEEQRASVCAALVRLVDTQGTPVHGCSICATLQTWPNVATSSWGIDDDVFLAGFVCGVTESYRTQERRTVWGCALRAPTTTKRAIISALRRACDRGACRVLAAGSIAALGSTEAALHQEALIETLTISEAHGTPLVPWGVTVTLLPPEDAHPEDLLGVVPYLPGLLAHDVRMPRVLFLRVADSLCSAAWAPTLALNALPFLDAIVTFVKRGYVRMSSLHPTSCVRLRVEFATVLFSALKTTGLLSRDTELHRKASKRFVGMLVAAFQHVDRYCHDIWKDVLFTTHIPGLLRDCVQPGSVLYPGSLSHLSKYLLAAMQCPRPSFTPLAAICSAFVLLADDVPAWVVRDTIALVGIPEETITRLAPAREVLIEVHTAATAQDHRWSPNRVAWVTAVVTAPVGKPRR